MNTPFVPAVVAPTEKPANALFFAFQDDKLLVYLDGDTARLPQGDDFAALGLPIKAQHYLGTAGATHYYAVELTKSNTPKEMSFKGLRDLFEFIDEAHFQLGARAVQIVAWNRTHQFCSQCGTPTQAHPRDRARICPDCGLQFFPRLSPAIIVLVEKGGELLLARSPRFPPGRYSVLAGFVEPGETLEEAVAREVREEVNIQVDNIRYFGSQSWPFPNSLMLGFTASYAGGEIGIDEDEIVDANWYSPDNLPELPPTISIARQLIDAFLAKKAHDQSR